MLDEDGYPTEETINKIKNWDPQDFRGLMEFMQKMWRWPSYFSLEGDVARVSTGGWSGHEEMIDVIPPVWRELYWYRTTRGGHYIFAPRWADMERDQ